MKEEDEKSGIARIAHGDEEKAREFRANLAVFARRSNNPQLRRLVVDVLGGRREVREVFATPEWRMAVSKNIARVERGIAALTDEQREQVFDPNRPRTPTGKLDAMRDKAVAGRPPLDAEPATADQATDGEERDSFMVRRKPKG